MEYLSDADLLEFSHAVEMARENLRTPSLFKDTKSSCRVNEFQILRRWNSHTPMISDEFGGGYFLRWQGKGTIIDPGCTFTDVFRQSHLRANVPPHFNHEYHTEAHCMDDIDLVIATHDHIDHCEELSILITLFRAFNKWLESDAELKGQEYESRMLDLVLSYGAYFKCLTLIEHPDNRKFLSNCCKILPKRGISEEKDDIDLREIYKLDLEALKTRHREVIGDDSGFGLRLALHDGGREFILCDTGDTAYDESLVEQYQRADLLILHVGTLEKMPDELTGRNEHLCFHGVVKILKQLRSQPKLVLLGEWGQEFGEPTFREKFTGFVREYSDINTPILPADLGMRIRIPDCYVWCSDTKDFEPPSSIRVVEVGQRLEYLSQ